MTVSNGVSEKIVKSGFFAKFRNASKIKKQNEVNLSESANIPKVPSVKINELALDGKKVRALGSGVSGKVELYFDKSANCYYAVKSFKPRESYESKKEYKDRCYQEFSLISGMKIGHENILNVYSFQKKNSAFQILMEFIPYGILDVIKSTRPENDEILCYFRQVCEGIKFLNSNYIAHRDLKMENLVLNEKGTLKIIDFGSAFKYGVERNQAIGIVGTEYLIGPEVFESIRYYADVADVWALGILLYSMLHLEFPWKKAGKSDLEYQKFLNCPDNLIKSRYPQSCWTLMSEILEQDPKRRISIERLSSSIDMFMNHHEKCPITLHSRTLRICAKRFPYDREKV